MQVLKSSEPISIADYLAGEQLSEVRHEFIGGAIYAMAGASEELPLRLASLEFSLPLSTVYEGVKV